MDTRPHCVNTSGVTLGGWGGLGCNGSSGELSEKAGLESGGSGGGSGRWRTWPGGRSGSGLAWRGSRLGAAQGQSPALSYLRGQQGSGGLGPQEGHGPRAADGSRAVRATDSSLGVTVPTALGVSGTPVQRAGCDHLGQCLIIAVPYNHQAKRCYFQGYGTGPPGGWGRFPWAWEEGLWLWDVRGQLLLRAALACGTHGPLLPIPGTAQHWTQNPSRDGACRPGTAVQQPVLTQGCSQVRRSPAVAQPKDGVWWPWAT